MRRTIAVSCSIVWLAAVAGATTITSVEPQAVRVGSEVVVTGTGMADVLHVYVLTEQPFTLVRQYTETGFGYIDDAHLEVFIPADAVNGPLRIDANFQPGLMTPAIELRTENDFNGDGRSDFLFRNASNEIFVWAVSCHRTVGIGYVATIPAGTEFVTTADFNGDNRADILWRDAVGDFGIWLMVNDTIIAAGPLPRLPAGMSFAGAADIDGDSRADIVLRDSAGGVGAWLMDGLTITAGGYIGAAPASFQILGLGDLDDNRKFDIVWIDANDMVGTWMLDGFTLLSGSLLGPKPPAVGTTFETIRDFVRLDGEWDILWRRQDPGCTPGWCQVTYTGWYMAGGAWVHTFTLSASEYVGPAIPHQATYGAPAGNVSGRIHWLPTAARYDSEQPYPGWTCSQSNGFFTGFTLLR